MADRCVRCGNKLDSLEMFYCGNCSAMNKLESELESKSYRDNRSWAEVYPEQAERLNEFLWNIVGGGILFSFFTPRMLVSVNLDWQFEGDYFVYFILYILIRFFLRKRIGNRVSLGLLLIIYCVIALFIAMVS